MRATLLAGALSMILAAPSLVIPGLVTPSLAATFVYVSNAEDGDIGMYALQADGSLRAGERVKTPKVVIAMAVSGDKRFLIAAVRSKPYQAHTYAIDANLGALKPVGTGPLAESFPYISL